jgi:hypothetical protein
MGTTRWADQSFRCDNKKMGNGLVSERLHILLATTFAVAATVFAGAAAAQDYDAGKSGPQLFASDCSACHKSPGGLAKGKDKGSLTSFLREHYTSKRESAELLAAFLLGAGPGDVKPDKGEPGGPKAKPRRAEREEEPKGEPKPEPKPRAEPARRAEEPGENREEAKRTRAEDREPPKGEAAAVLSKLKYYGSARGPAKDTAHLASPGRRLETYANSSSNTVTPDRGTHDDAAKRKPVSRKKKKDADAAATAAGEHPPRPPKPPQPAVGNN